MILNTGCRTDIPAFYSKWFYNRIKDGYVRVRSPYRKDLIRKYKIDPSVVDVICFCTKNPSPRFDSISLLNLYRQFWFVTLTPYGKDIEPNVPDKLEGIEFIKRLSSIVGRKCVSWRYDPIFVTEKYSLSYHIRAFGKICSELSGYVSSCVISFLDLYEKTKWNFPKGREVTLEEQEYLAREFSMIAEKHSIRLRACCENPSLKRFGIDVDGCRRKEILEEALDIHLAVKAKYKNPRSLCSCLLGSDIGRYNTCGHFCRYCYANENREKVKKNRKRHDPSSPLLIGHITKEDHILERKQESFRDETIPLF